MGIGARQPQLLQWAGALQGAGVSFRENRVSVTLQGDGTSLPGWPSPALSRGAHGSHLLPLGCPWPQSSPAQTTTLLQPSPGA